MRLSQDLKVAAKTGATVTLSKLIAGNPAGYSDVEARPKYLGLDAIVMTCTTSPFDPTFWGCPGVVRCTFDKLS